MVNTIPPLSDPATRKYLVRALGYWGAGPTPEAAIRNARAAGWRPRDGGVLYEVDKAAYVDSYGSICTPPRNAVGDPVVTRAGAMVFDCDGEPVPGQDPVRLCEL